MLQKYLDFLYNLGEFNIKLGLSTIQEMLFRLGNPHHHPRIIHIAGTNGKGSTLSALEHLLTQSGYTTGSTVSPHLVSYNERFRINGSPIDDTQLHRLFDTVCEKCDIPLDLSRRSSSDEKIKPTFFEFSIAIAFLLFKEMDVDYILLETGMGGRLDATNIVEHPIACAITRIDIDHQEFLGDSIIDIANEKLGIIKPGAPLFIAAQEQKVMDHIRLTCDERDINTFYYATHFHHAVDDESKNHIRIHYTKTNQRFVEKTIRYDKFGLVGDHQHENLSTALALYYTVVEERRWMADEDIVSALTTMYWPARLEYFGDKKNILIDGAHNRSGVKSLLSFLDKHHAGQRILFAIGWMKGKNFIDTFEDINCDSITFIPLQGRSERSETGESVIKAFTDRGYQSLPFIRADQLPGLIRETKLPDYDVLVLSGSFYLIGEFLEEWQKLAKP